jgi:hypothetical protein
LNTIERTFQYFISNINIQFGAMLDGMPKNLLYYFSTAIILAGLMPISLAITSVYAQPPPGSPYNPPPFPLPFGQPPFARASNFTFGPIASIQNDESGKPKWIVIGFWRSNLLSINETTTTATTTENSDGNASNLAAAAIFNANLRMIMLNGSGAHTHVITNFKLSNVSSNENGTVTYIGNSTVSMPDAPIADVPTTIKISGEIISIFPDPSKVNEHFGDTPIYGVVANRAGNDIRHNDMRQPLPPRGPPFP